MGAGPAPDAQAGESKESKVAACEHCIGRSRRRGPRLAASEHIGADEHGELNADGHPERCRRERLEQHDTEGEERDPGQEADLVKHGSFRAFSDKLAVLVGIGAAHDGRDLYDAIWLTSSIAKLKPALRDTAVLVAGQQLTHAEAARILGVAEATVSWRMHEARRLLSAADD